MADLIPLALYFVVLVFGYLLGAWYGRRNTRDTELLDFLETTGYSLHCLRGPNGDDDIWAVTDGATRLVSSAEYTPRAAIESAANGGNNG